MEERRSDTEETFGGQDPAADVSSQNSEEAPGGQGGQQDRQADPDRHPDRHSREGPRESSSGEETEAARAGSQSTGHPANAG